LTHFFSSNTRLQLYNKDSCRKKCRIEKYFPKDVCEKACEDVTDKEDKKPCRKDCYRTELRKVRRICRWRCPFKPKPETIKFKINGAYCYTANIVKVGDWCIPGAPRFDKEGSVCANDGKGKVAYCSYGVGFNACAYCDN